MHKKRYLFLLVSVVLPVIVDSMIFLGSEWYRMEWNGAYTACRNQVPFVNDEPWVYDGTGFSPVKSEEPWVYDGTDFSPVNYYPFTVDFYSETGRVSCHVRRNGSEWQLILYSTSSIPN